MTKHEKRLNDLMEMLYRVPTVKEHLQKLEVQMGKIIILRRASLGLSQSDVVNLVNENGGTISRETISKAESGEFTIDSGVYDNILKALAKDGYKITIKFH